MKKNDKLLWPVILALVAFVIAVLFRIFSLSDIWAQMFGAFIGAMITVIITLLLLKSQTSSEEEKERNSKVFEEKLRIYQEFLKKLCEVVKDMNIEKSKEIELEFQVSYIAMHTSYESLAEISKQVREIITAIKEGDSERNKMLKQLFVIADTFYKELYNNVNVYDDEKRQETIQNFNSIMFTAADIKLIKRAIELQKKINSNGAKQRIWKDTTLVYEFYTDKNKNTGNYIVVDMIPKNDSYEVTVYKRNANEQQNKELAESLFGTYRPTDENRHLFDSIALSKSNDEISMEVSKLLSDIKAYRDKKISD